MIRISPGAGYGSIAIVASAEGEKKLIDMGMIPGAPTPRAELARFLAREVADWGKIVRRAGIVGGGLLDDWRVTLR